MLYTIAFFRDKNAVLDLAVLYTITILGRKNAVFYLAVLYTITLFGTFLEQRRVPIINTIRIPGAGWLPKRGPSGSSSSMKTIDLEALPTPTSRATPIPVSNPIGLT